MDEILGQLGGLLLGSVPTVIFMVLLYGVYTGLVHKPLVKALAERHSRTEGAVERARADIGAAEARTGPLAPTARAWPRWPRTCTGRRA